MAALAAGPLIHRIATLLHRPAAQEPQAPHTQTAAHIHPLAVQRKPTRSMPNV